jgi:hypothetical protein
MGKGVVGRRSSVVSGGAYFGVAVFPDWCWIFTSTATALRQDLKVIQLDIAPDEIRPQ